MIKISKQVLMALLLSGSLAIGGVAQYPSFAQGGKRPEKPREKEKDPPKDKDRDKPRDEKKDKKKPD